jgi:hypothetical protein
MLSRARRYATLQTIASIVNTMLRLAGYAMMLLTTAAAWAQAQKPPPNPAKTMIRYFETVSKEVLEMAQDFPAEKYDFRLKPEMRSFGEVIVHVMSGTVYAAKAGRGEKVNWDEIDAKKYHGKAEIVTAFQKAIEDATGVLKGQPEEKFTKTLEPWMGVVEHTAEHYGLLVAYYRANGLVPPQSRPKSK